MSISLEQLTALVGELRDDVESLGAQEIAHKRAIGQLEMDVETLSERLDKLDPPVAE